MVGKNRFKDLPPWLKLATTLEKPPTPYHEHTKKKYIYIFMLTSWFIFMDILTCFFTHLLQTRRYSLYKGMLSLRKQGLDIDFALPPDRHRPVQEAFLANGSDSLATSTDIWKNSFQEDYAGYFMCCSWRYRPRSQSNKIQSRNKAMYISCSEILTKESIQIYTYHKRRCTIQILVLPNLLLLQRASARIRAHSVASLLGSSAIYLGKNDTNIYMPV